jgi:EAL domain-containing protein (putative c-di-GMP-specific phosphodiesterase class I)
MTAAARGYSLEFIQSMLSEDGGRMYGWINDLKLKSVFQPAFSLPHKKAIGFDAHMRSADSKGRPVAPRDLFGPTANFAETSMLDLLCSTMHVHNFFLGSKPHGLLLLNLHPDVFVDYEATGPFLSSLFRRYDVPGGRVMIDIPGSQVTRDGVGEAARAYRQLGCLIAVDDFGVENTDLDSIWHLVPSLVKMGPGMMSQALASARMRQTLPRAVSLLHELGSLVLAEGLESEMEALIAIDADADFGTGHYFGPPLDLVDEFRPPEERLNGIWRTYREKRVSTISGETAARQTLEAGALRSSYIGRLRQASPEKIRRHREVRRPYILALQKIASLLDGPGSFEASCAAFLELPGTIRCFLLDDQGGQVGPDVRSLNPPKPQAPDFHRLAGECTGDWSRRDFFLRAVKEPGITQVSRQYCSLTGYLHCVTFSLALRMDGKTYVVCGDVDWTENAAAAGDPQPARAASVQASS